MWDVLLIISAFLGYAFVFSLPSMALAFFVVVVTKIDTKWLIPLWVLITVLTLWSLDIHLMLVDLF